MAKSMPIPVEELELKRDVIRWLYSKKLDINQIRHLGWSQIDKERKLVRLEKKRTEKSVTYKVISYKNSPLDRLTTEYPPRSSLWVLTLTYQPKARKLPAFMGAGGMFLDDEIKKIVRYSNAESSAKKLLPKRIRFGNIEIAKVNV